MVHFWFCFSEAGSKMRFLNQVFLRIIHIKSLFRTIIEKYDKHLKEETEGVVKKYSVICDKLNKFTR